MEILDIVAYFVRNSTIKLSKGRLNKLVYLADWKYSLDYGKQLSNISWKFNHYGPYVNEIENSIESDLLKRFKITHQETSYFGHSKYIINLIDDSKFIAPNDSERTTLDMILKLTDKLNWTDFINLVYSTYPIKVSERGDILHLVALAKQYRNQQ